MIPWELQHRLVVVDLDKKVLKKIVSVACNRIFGPVSTLIFF